LAELRSALEEIPERGQVFLISGEPGIGKTRLAEEISREAPSHRMRVVWGRCWEGEGAPAFWPWIQVIRGCVGTTDSPERRALLASDAAVAIETVAQIVPELRRPDAKAIRPGAKSDIDPDSARFRLLDSVSTLLRYAAQRAPLAIVIDDIHDADKASIEML